MVERVPQHKHCRNCEKAIPIDREYCNETCQADHEGGIKAKKRQLLIFYMIMVVVFIFALIFSLS